ncbi:metallophosphoesterase, partial [Virgibacillus sp. DJP39]|uniref:metallophosphoesterase n=1 Tax=Virgibacillus sp. DJP39 TaxID=3409790 RepID=UPI003BB57609
MDNTSTVKRVVGRVVEMEPSAVLLLGDYVYHSVGNREAEMKKVMDFLEPLSKSNIPTFALLGNHD